MLKTLMEPLHRQGHDAQAIAVERTALVRYVGQSTAVEVPFADPLDLATLGRDFRRRHNDIYGYATDEHWEMQSLRVRTLRAAADDVRSAGRLARHAGADQRRSVLVRAAGAAPDAALRSRSPAAGRADRRPGHRRGCLVDHHRAARLRPARRQDGPSLDQRGQLMKNSIDPFTVEVIRHAPDGGGRGDVVRRHALGALAAAARGRRPVVGPHRSQGRSHRAGPRHPDPSRRHELHGEEVSRARSRRAPAAGRRVVPQPAGSGRQSPARREGDPADLPRRTPLRLCRQPGPLGRYRRRLGRQLLRRRHRDLAGRRAHPAAAPVHR